MQVQGVLIFLFEDDELVCEKVYFDHATILSQLGVLSLPQANVVYRRAPREQQYCGTMRWFPRMCRFRNQSRVKFS
jgi:hypothetical protein